MKTARFLCAGILAAAVAALSTASYETRAQQPASAAPRIDNNDLGGVVTGSKGPEAGVWVIATTTDLPTPFTRIVVTDDQGRYVVPDLPAASYSVWVRGYGLVDSPRVRATPGKIVNLTAVPAPNARAAAEYYPAGYWFSLLHIPDKSEFPGTGPQGNGISANIKTQADYIQRVKSGGCMACHHLGNKATREIPKSLGTFESSADACNTEASMSPTSMRWPAYRCPAWQRVASRSRTCTPYPGSDVSTVNREKRACRRACSSTMSSESAGGGDSASKRSTALIPCRRTSWMRFCPTPACFVWAVPIKP